ncbi:MAG: hypothetical protein ACN2B6_03780 [Rickettsiales bacterium]
MSEQEPKKVDDLTRIIVLVYGALDNGNPFWVYVAVKPSQYDEFMKAQKEGSLDLYNFDGFGEIIVCGESKLPPDEVTLKVAEMYQTDPSTLFKQTDPEKEAEELAASVKKEEKNKENK